MHDKPVLSRWAAVMVLVAAAATSHAQLAPITSPLSVANTCAQLTGLPVMGGTTDYAVMQAPSPYVSHVQAGGPNPPMPGEYQAARPTHCLVRGSLNKRIGSDGKPYEILFEVRLPVIWNGRFLYQGGAGYDGILRAADGNTGPLYVDTPSALAKGFVVASTDAGHEREDGKVDGDYLFGADAQAREEYGFQQVAQVHRAALQVIARAYGQMPVKSYIVGSSNGGRQGMMAAQRFPELFDGIVSIMPGFHIVPASLVGGNYRAQLIARIAPHRADGTPDLDHPLSAPQLKVISARILEACDAQDGLKDGMVFKALTCKVDPMAWVCAPGERGGCLTRPEAAFVRDFMAEPKLKNGSAAYPRLPVDPNVTAVMAVAEGGMSWFPLFWGGNSRILTVPPSPDAGMLDYLLKSDFDAEFAKTFARSDRFPRSGVESFDADSPDLDQFKRHGGKLMIVNGTADQIFSALDAASYIDAVTARYGKDAADSFARLYLIPGFGHGAPYKQSTTQVDYLGAIVDWVENGKVPESLTAGSRLDSDWPDRTRPLCTYPKVAIYAGHGPAENAASFTCE